MKIIKQQMKIVTLFALVLIFTSLQAMARMGIEDMVVRGAIKQISNNEIVLTDGSHYKLPGNSEFKSEFAVGDVVYVRYYTSSDQENICLEISKTPLEKNEKPKQEEKTNLS